MPYKYLIQDFIDQWAVNAPSKTAVCYKTENVSYKEIFTRSNKLAHTLKSSGVNRQQRVLVCCKRCGHSIIIFLGALKADAIYVPVDHKSPLNRIIKIINDCQPKAIVCDSFTLEYILSAVEEASVKVPLLFLYDHLMDKKKYSHLEIIDTDDINSHSSVRPDCKNIDTDIAYIMYTSGTTGQPKGVLISHKNLKNYVYWGVEDFKILSTDIVLSIAPFYFDMSVFDIYCTLGAGSTLIVLQDELLLFPIEIMKVIEEKQVTLLKAVSSLLTYFSKTKSLLKGRMPTLKRLLFAGEVLPVKHLIEWMETYPHIQFYNAYGPTEATGVSAFYHVKKVPSKTLDSVPIGKACTNSDVFLLTVKNAIAEPGEPGEICIRGSSLSKGYWDDREKTGRVFIVNPLTNNSNDIIFKTRDTGIYLENGNIQFKGRKDYQIKYMGHRIEPGEIESALLKSEYINDAVVIKISDQNSGVQEIAVFFESSITEDTVQMKKNLRHWLPEYMVPKYFISVESIPRNNRGKVDRQKLKKVFNKDLSTQNDRS